MVLLLLLVSLLALSAAAAAAERLLADAAALLPHGTAGDRPGPRAPVPDRGSLPGGADNPADDRLAEPAAAGFPPVSAGLRGAGGDGRSGRSRSPPVPVPPLSRIAPARRGRAGPGGGGDVATGGPPASSTRGLRKLVVDRVPARPAVLRGFDRCSIRSGSGQLGDPLDPPARQPETDVVAGRGHGRILRGSADRLTTARHPACERGDQPASRLLQAPAGAGADGCRREARPARATGLASGPRRARAGGRAVRAPLRSRAATRPIRTHERPDRMPCRQGDEPARHGQTGRPVRVATPRRSAVGHRPRISADRPTSDRYGASRARSSRRDHRTRWRSAGEAGRARPKNRG